MTRRPSRPPARISHPWPRTSHLLGVSSATLVAAACLALCARIAPSHSPIAILVCLLAAGFAVLLVTSINHLRNSARDRHTRALTDRLHVSTREVERLGDELLRVQDRERKRLAGAIHDDVLGVLLQMLGRVDEAAAALPKQSPAAAHLLLATELGDHAAENLRTACADLYPPQAAQRDSHAALLEVASSARRYDGLDVTFTGTACWSDIHLSPTAETILCRVARQALDNTHRHAHATRASIHLGREAGHIVLTIADDGRGFALRPPLARLTGQHYGLITMQDRVEDLGGTLTLRSSPGEGTEIVARLPIQRAPHPHLSPVTLVPPS